MKIVFSRHAKRRMKLYAMDESEILAKLQHQLPSADGAHEFSWPATSARLPLKLIAALEAGILTVVTVYPLKKRRNP